MTGVVGSSASPLGPLVEDSASSEDLLPRGFDQQLLIAYGDRFTNSGERFGFNADFTAFFPRTANGAERLLAVNPYVGTDTDSYGQAFTEVGVSVVHIRKNANASWSVSTRIAPATSPAPRPPRARTGNAAGAGPRSTLPPLIVPRAVARTFERGCGDPADDAGMSRCRQATDRSQS